MDYTRWSFLCETDEQFVVYPDGCRDLLIIDHPDGHREFRVSNLDLHPRIVALKAGMKVTGYRMKPGVVVRAQALDLHDRSEPSVQLQINEMVQHSNEITEAVEMLSSSDHTVSQAARRAGVSTRTLQRRFKTLELPHPDFWRLLGRARRAAIALVCSAAEPGHAACAHIALESGFSDQAHLTRECQRWFRHSPEKLRKNSQLAEQLTEPGLGNWTTTWLPESKSQ
ncbi:MAG: helix-turn-helix domain-containing protein [Granulosicoccus sp.]